MGANRDGWLGGVGWSASKWNKTKTQSTALRWYIPFPICHVSSMLQIGSLHSFSSIERTNERTNVYSFDIDLSVPLNNNNKAATNTHTSEWKWKHESDWAVGCVVMVWMCLLGLIVAFDPTVYRPHINTSADHLVWSQFDNRLAGHRTHSLSLLRLASRTDAINLSHSQINQEHKAWESTEWTKLCVLCEMWLRF